MFSILYLTQEETIKPIIETTVKTHALIYTIPFFSIPLSSIPSIGEFVKNSVTTRFVVIVKETSYLHLKNLTDLANGLDSTVDFLGNHYVDQYLDVDAGYFVRSTALHTFTPNPFTTFTDFSISFTRHLASIPKFHIILRLGFNVLNFEGSYYHTHNCEKCIESFSKSIPFTLGNMSDEDFVKYHAIVEKNRVGKNVQIALALMIKDEESKIKDTLDYYKNSEYFPEFFVLDTGSTDGTIDRVKEWADSHPSTKVVIYEQPFVDFSTSRNYLLDKAYDNACSEYIISVDCNDEMRGQAKCIESLYLHAHYPGVFIDQVWKGESSDPITFTNIRIVKNNRKYRWRYRVHEVMMTDNEVPIMVRLSPDVHLYQFRESEYEQGKSARYHRDLKFFIEDVEKYPFDKRIAYYLSQTYFFCQDYENCIVSGKRRLALNGPNERDEECYQTLLRITKCKLFLKKDMDNVKKWLWRTWEYFAIQNKKDIEPLMQIAQYYETTDIDTAIALYRLACDTPKPAFTLPVRNELYTFERYKKLAEQYYKKRDFDNVYASYSKIVKDINPRLPKSDAIKAVDNMLNLYYPSHHRKDKPVLVIYGGLFYDRSWNGKLFYEKTISLGGSESMVIKLAHLLKKEYHVYVFVNTHEEVSYDDVQYLKYERYNDFVLVNRVKHLIVSRDASKMIPEYRSRVEKAHLWLHDLVEISKLPEELYDTIVTLTPYHKKFYEQYTAEQELSASSKSSIRSKLRIIPNSVSMQEDLSYKSISKAKNMSGHRFIYSSCPTRGLEKVLKDFTELKAVYSDAELYIYCDFDNDYVKSRMDLPAIQNTIRSTKDVYNVGRLPENMFLEECKKANFWYYPTEFKETFCITAVQMMMNGVIPIYTNVGALSHVIDNAGIVFDPVKDTLASVIRSIDPLDKRVQVMKRGIERARRYVDTNVKKDWIALFK
jgi:hypothetical protein